MSGARRGEPSPGSDASTWTVAALLTSSGVSALVYLTAWQRQLRIVFGASFYASCAVLGVLCLAFGLGALVLGKRVERSTRPLSFYAQLELGAAVSAGASPIVLLGVSKLYADTGGSLALGAWGATALRVAMATLVMGGPVFLLGGTLPAAARAVEATGDPARTRTALLYGASACGGVVGALLGAFLLFERFGTRNALWLAAALGVVVALLARWLGRHASDVPTLVLEDVAGPDGDAPRRSALKPQGLRSTAMHLAAAVQGLGFVLLGLVWVRLLPPILGGSTLAFAVMLAVALAGLCVGGCVYSRRQPEQRATVALLATTTACAASCVIVPFALGDAIAVYAALTRPLAHWGLPWLVGSWVSLTLLVVFPAAVACGYQFALLPSLLGTGRTGVAEHVGRSHAVHAAAGIVAVPLGGFVLVPLLGATGTWKLVAVLFALTALGVAGAAMVSHLRHVRRVAWAIALVSATLLMTSAQGPSAAWYQAAGAADHAKLHPGDRNQLEAWRRHASDQRLWERDGVETRVAVTNTHGISVTRNGEAETSAFGDRGTQTLLGLLPALLHSAPKSAFVVGLGTGMTAGWLGKVEGMQRVDVAELEPTFSDVAKLTGAMNHDVMSLPNVHVHYGDGRELLLASRSKYDLIVNEPNRPHALGAPHLFTHEFYGVVRSKLNERGLFAQRALASELDAQATRSVIATLRSQFAFVEAWQTQGDDLLFVASARPRSLDVNALRAKLGAEPYRTAARRMWLVQDAEGVLSHFVAAAPLIDEMGRFQHPTVDTDDRSAVEYVFARHVDGSAPSVTLRLLRRARERGLHRPRTTGEVDWTRVDELRPRAWLIRGAAAPDLPLPDGARDRLAALSAACTGRLDEVMKHWNAQPQTQPSDHMELFAVALGTASLGFADAYPHVGELNERGYAAESSLALGHLASRSGSPARAIGHHLEGLDALRAGEIPLCGSAEQLLSAIVSVAGKDPASARAALPGLAKGPLLAQVSEGARLAAMSQLGFAQMDGDGADPRLCVIALDRQLDHPAWEHDFLEKRLRCLERAEHPMAGAARADLDRYLRWAPGPLTAAP